MNSYFKKTTLVIKEKEVAVNVPVKICKKFIKRTVIKKEEKEEEEEVNLYYVTVVYNDKKYNIDICKSAWDFIEKDMQVYLSIIQRNGKYDFFIFLNSEGWNLLKESVEEEKKRKEEEEKEEIKDL
jgi:hypothetical protein